MTQISSDEIVIMGGFAISSALKGLFMHDDGGLDGLSDIYIYNMRRNRLRRVDHHNTEQPAGELKIHPWHMVTRSMQERVAITFNYDTNQVIEVSFPEVHDQPPRL